MDLNGLEQPIAKYPGHVALGAASLGAMLGCAVGWYLRGFKARENQEDMGPSAETSRKSVQELGENKDLRYLRRSVEGAINGDGCYSVEAHVVNFNVAQNGFSGVLSDGLTMAPFYVGCEVLECDLDGGIAAIILRDSEQDAKPITWRVQRDSEKNILLVHGIEYHLGEKEYKIDCWFPDD